MTPTSLSIWIRMWLLILVFSIEKCHRISCALPSLYKMLLLWYCIWAVTLFADWCSERFTVSVMQHTNVKLKRKVALKSTSSSPQSPWFCMDTKMPLVEMWFIFYSSELIFKCENVHICDVAIVFTSTNYLVIFSHVWNDMEEKLFHLLGPWKISSNIYLLLFTEYIIYVTI